VGLLSDSGAAAMSRPFGREPYGRAAAARSAAPLPQVGGARSYAAPMGRACKRGPDPSSVPGILSPLQIPVKGAPAARRLLTQPQTLDCALPRPDHRHLSVGRGSPSPAVPTSAEFDREQDRVGSSGRRGRRFKSGHPDPFTGHAIFAGGLFHALSDRARALAAGKRRSRAVIPGPMRQMSGNY
jgi:hypothetical protein